MALFIFSQSGADLRIQDGGAHESRPCWKTAHQPTSTCLDNTVKITGNGSTNIGKVIMPRIRNGSGKDFMTRSKEN